MEDGGFQSGIAAATSSLQKLDKETTLARRGLDNFFKGNNVEQMKSAFDGVSRVLSNLEKKMGSAGTGMKQQMKSMTVAAQELEQIYRKLSEAEQQSGEGQQLRQHIDELIAKSGELKDTMTDVQGAIKFASSDTAQLQAFAQGLTALSAAAQVGTSALSLFGVSEEKVAAVQKTIITLIGITNGLQTIQNALQKESNLMQFISIARTKGLAVALGLRTAATVAATTAETAETAAVEANTAAWASNPIGAIIIAVLAAVTAVVALTKAFSDNTDKLEENTAAAKAHEEQLQKNKESDKAWAESVATNAGNQLATYRKLQNKWKECNGDIKLQQKFIKDYKNELDSLGLGIKGVLGWEKAFCDNTNNVVNAILARARAEAYEEEYKKAVQDELKIRMDKSVAGGGSYYTLYRQLDKGKNSATGSEMQAYERATGKRAISGGGGQSSQGYILTEDAQRWIDNQRRQAANDLKNHRLAENKQRQDWLDKEAHQEAEILGKNIRAAGGDPTPPANPYANRGGSGGKGGSRGSKSRGGSGGKGGRSGTTPPEEKPREKSIAWYEAQINAIRDKISKGLVPDNELENYLNTIERYTEEKEKLEVKYGWKQVPFEPAEDSLAGMTKKLHQLQDDLQNGLVPDEDIDKTREKIEKLEEDIQAKKIQLRLEEPPETDYEKSEKQRKEFLKGYKDYLHNITSYAKDDDQYKKNLEAIKAYNEERDKAEKNWADNIPALSEDARQREEKQRQELAKLTDQLQKGKITVEQFDEAMAHLDNTLDEVTAVAPKPLKKPITFDLGNIPQQYQDVIAEIDRMLSQDDLEIEERIRLNETKASLEKKVNDITHGELSIPAKIVPEYIVKGSDEDLRQSYQNALQEAQQLQNDYEIGLINYDKAKSDLDKINEMLEKLHLKPITLEIKSELFKQLDYAADTLNNFGSAISQLGNVAQDKALNAAGVIAQAIANIWLGYSQASVQSAKLGPWAWLGFSAGALAQVIGVIAALKSNSFAGGGIVGGSSYHGDKIYARLNSGEMLLNRKQQANLFRMLDGGHSGTSSGNVEFKIKGQELVGVIKNYNDKKSKLR